MKEFSGRVAVITGGASGIGLGLAHRLADEGMKIVVADIEENVLDSAVEELKANGAEAHGHICDVSDRDQVEALANKVFDLTCLFLSSATIN